MLTIPCESLVAFGLASALLALAGTIGAGLRASPKAGVYLNRIAGSYLWRWR